VVVDTSNLLVKQLRSGELDIVVGRILDADAAAELHFEPVTDEPHSLIVRAGHPLLSCQTLQLSDLVLRGWILPPSGSILRDRLTAMFLSAGLEPPSETVETLALPVIASLLTGSDMIVALPLELVQPYLQSKLLAVLPFELGLRMDLYGLITRRGNQLSPGAAAMLETLREVCALRYPKLT